MATNIRKRIEGAIRLNIIERIGELLQSIAPDITVYRENQREGFDEPSFFVSQINTTLIPEMFKRQNRKYSYQIVYFPTIEHPKTDMESMQGTLLDNFIQLDNFATIRNRDFAVVDGTLTLTFEVWVRAYPEDLTPKQQTLDSNTVNLKGGQ